MIAVQTGRNFFNSLFYLLYIMDLFKKYIAEQLIGKTLHFRCDCLIPLNHTGTIVGYEISSNEILFTVNVDGKIIKIGENHPNLQVEQR